MNPELPPPDVMAAHRKRYQALVQLGAGSTPEAAEARRKAAAMIAKNPWVAVGVDATVEGGARKSGPSPLDRLASRLVARAENAAVRVLDHVVDSAEQWVTSAVGGDLDETTNESRGATMPRARTKRITNEALLKAISFAGRVFAAEEGGEEDDEGGSDVVIITVYATVDDMALLAERVAESNAFGVKIGNRVLQTINKTLDGNDPGEWPLPEDADEDGEEEEED